MYKIILTKMSISFLKSMVMFHHTELLKETCSKANRLLLKLHSEI